MVAGPFPRSTPKVKSDRSPTCGNRSTMGSSTAGFPPRTSTRCDGPTRAWRTRPASASWISTCSPTMPTVRTTSTRPTSRSTSIIWPPARTRSSELSGRVSSPTRRARRSSAGPGCEPSKLGLGTLLARDAPDFFDAVRARAIDVVDSVGVDAGDVLRLGLLSDQGLRRAALHLGHRDEIGGDIVYVGVVREQVEIGSVSDEAADLWPVVLAERRRLPDVDRGTADAAGERYRLDIARERRRRAILDRDERVRAVTVDTDDL